MFKNLKFMLFLKFFNCKNMINYNKINIYNSQKIIKNIYNSFCTHLN